MTKIALITGASRGIGRALALELAAHGHDVIGTYLNDAGRAEETRGALAQAGVRASMLPLDIAGESDFTAFADQLRDVLRRDFDRESLDILVNNAGFGVNAPLLSVTRTQFDQMINIHLRGPLFLTQALAPLMAEGGRILNLSSGLTQYVMPGMGAYAAAKGSVEVLTRYLAEELGERGVRVNTLAPGAVATDFGGGAVRDNPEVAKFVAGMVALGRVAQPEDLGKAAVALLSDEMAWASGARFDVSGGQRL